MNIYIYIHMTNKVYIALLKVSYSSFFFFNILLEKDKKDWRNKSMKSSTEERVTLIVFEMISSKRMTVIVRAKGPKISLFFSCSTLLGNRDCTAMSYECHSAGMNTGCLLDALQKAFQIELGENVRCCFYAPLDASSSRSRGHRLEPWLKLWEGSKGAGGGVDGTRWTVERERKLDR